MFARKPTALTRAPTPPPLVVKQPNAGVRHCNAMLLASGGHVRDARRLIAIGCGALTLDDPRPCWLGLPAGALAL